MKNLFAILACISLFAACKPDTGSLEPSGSTNNNINSTTSSNYIKFTAKGTSYNYGLIPSQIASEVDYYDASSHILNLTTYKTLASYTEVATLTIINVDLDNITLPYTAYADSSFGVDPYPGFSWNLTQDDRYESGGEVGVDPFPYFTVTITSKTADVVEGTFSGTIKDTADVSKHLTDGMFKVKITRK